MSLVINTNVSSLQAQDNLNTSQAQQQTAIEQLSTGLQINSAADNPAGLAIASRFTAQINGDGQAVNNANDGIALVQTAGSALSSITNDLQSIRQLAVQAANGTNSATDRAALDTESQQLLSEINQQAGSASFNGVSLLDGSNPSLTFQVGANTTANDSITVSGLPNATLSGLGSVYAASNTGTAATATTAIAAGALVINGVAIGAVDAGVNTSASPGGQTAAVSFAQNLQNAINSVSSQTGVTASIDATTGGIDLASTSSQGISTTGSVAAALTQSGLGAGVTATNTTGLTSLSLLTSASAEIAINQVDSALAQINTAQSTLGAVQNRFTSVVSNLQSTTVNLTSARSGIEDTNYAAATASLTQANILQQSGVAVLSQANSSQKNVLSLLQNL